MYTTKKFNFETFSRAIGLDMQLEHTLKYGIAWLQCWQEVRRNYEPNGIGGILSLDDPDGYRISDRVALQELGKGPLGAMPYIENELRMFTEYVYSTLCRLNNVSSANADMTGGNIFDPEDATVADHKEFVETFMDSLKLYRGINICPVCTQQVQKPKLTADIKMLA